MLGIIVQLAISWILVWLIQRNDLRVLGFFPTKRRLLDFVLFFIITAFCCSLGFLIKTYAGGLKWEVNPALTAGLVLEGLSWNIKSVLFEELIFRGVILYILIRKIGFSKAIILSAVAFGIYHWFSFGILGQITPMIFVFLMTGAMGVLLAYAYSKTLSLYIPCAIHLGWNFTQGIIFSDGPIGNGIFKTVGSATFRTDSYFIYYTALLLPIIAMFIINFTLLKRKTQVDVGVYDRRKQKSKPEE